MNAILVKATRDLRRRRLQAAVIFITTLLASTTATMALMLISQPGDPYTVAFAAQKGAHLQVGFDSKLDPGTLAATPSLIGAAAHGGPYRSSVMQFESGGHKYVVTAMGRDNPGGDVEQLRIVAGHWPAGDHEIALTQSFANLNHVSIGDTLKVVSVPQQPVLTVAAEVVDIDEVRADVGGQNAWVLASAIGSVTTQDKSFTAMNYRFASDPTNAQLQAAMDKLRASLPPGAVTNSTSYTLIRSVFNVPTQVLTGVLVAFSVLALAATAAIVANLVSGIVMSSYREIGIMKAVGFTPLQVVGVFLLQVLGPAAAACVAGIPAGTLLSQPLLSNSSQAIGLAYQPTYSPALGLLALAGALLVVAVAALVPALRAGLLKPAVVVANATAPRGHSGRWLRRLASRAGLPRPVVLGLGDAAARPLRAILTVVAIFVGVSTLIVALGETRGFASIYSYEGHIGSVDVAITKSPALSDVDAMRLIESQPETERVVARTTDSITVPGIADPVFSTIFRGESAKLGYLLTAGRWINGPGEVVAPRGLVEDAGLKMGDTFDATFRGATLKLRIVGEVYDVISGPGGHELMLDWSTITPVVPEVSPSGYMVALKPGSNIGAYVRRLAAAQPDLLDVQAANTGNTGFFATINAVLFAIALVIAL
ncbi:MAG TPA: ABC transporter permease, partial [Candidatus Dormibacteraeota bacterium]